MGTSANSEPVPASYLLEKFYVTISASALTESRLVIFTVRWVPSLALGTKTGKRWIRAMPSFLGLISVMSTS